MNSRLTAINILTDVLQHRSSLNVIPNVVRIEKDKAFIQEICYGVCRFYFQLDSILSRLLRKSLQPKELNIKVLLLIALYQLIYMRHPSYAVVNEAVNAVKDLRKPWAGNLVNAVLRNFLRQSNILLEACGQNEEIQYSHPGWLLDSLKRDWPHKWQSICEVNNQYPPMSLRVAVNRMSREDYMMQLAAKNIAAIASEHCHTGVILKSSVHVNALPGFKEGLVSVQDCSAQFAASLLDLKPGQRVLDACAAPGGKTLHILEQEKDLSSLVAVDKDKSRLQKVRDNLQRANLKAQLICADVADPRTFQDQEKFDRILLDAPCSGVGVIQRHPDIKILKQANDVAVLQQEQLRLLNAAWKLLKSGGKILYVTCSILAEENQQVIGRFLKDHPEAKEIPLQIDCAVSLSYGQQILPGEHMNGFYYCLLRYSNGV